MEFKDIINTSDREFKDISSEDYRKYTFPKNDVVFVHRPIGLHVSKSGHYVIDNQEISHFIPFGFVHLEWKPKKDKPNVVC